MSDLDNAINSINASAAKAENTAGFLDDMSTFDDQSSVTNPNNGQTVASIPKQVKDRTDELFAAAESDINQSVSDAEQSAIEAQDAADSIGRYQGLWPDTGGIADKGDTYQTQVSGTPTGQYFTALQNTTTDPIGDDVNWRAVVSFSSVSGENLIPNSSFEIAGSVTNPPDATPRSYSAEAELFQGFKAVGAISGVTYVDGKLNGPGQLYVDVYKSEKQKLSTALYVASIASSDGVPVESGASFVDNGDYWRVTFEMNDTFSVKLELGTVATRHGVESYLDDLDKIKKDKSINFGLYLPNGANSNYLADIEWSKAVQDCISNGSHAIYIPLGVTFKLSKYSINKNTANYLAIWSDVPSRYDDEAAPLIMTDDERAFDVGVDDGNPDSTGFTRSVTLENIQLGTSNVNSDVAVNVVNTSHFRIKGCRTYGFAEGSVRTEGGNVFFFVDDTEGFGYTGRNATTGQGSGIVMGEKYWGVFVLKVKKFHTFQYKYAVDLGKGRALSFEDVSAENLQHSVYRLSGSDEIYSLNILNGYNELVPQYVIHDDGFSGSIYNMSVRSYEAHECPGKSPIAFSNLSRSRVLNYSSSGIIMQNPVLDSQLGLTTDGRYQSVDEFDPGTTIAPRSDTFKDEQYEYRRHYEGMGSLKLEGNFTMLDGAAPYGWSYINGLWTKESAPVKSGISLKCDAGGNYEKAKITILNPSYKRRWACAVTFTGDLSVKADGEVKFSASGRGWNTEVFNFTVTTSANQFDLVIGTVVNADDSIEIAELRVWQIESSDATEVGWTSGLTQSAIRSALYEGSY